MKTFDINNIQLQIQSPGMVVDESLESYLISLIDKLGRAFPRITKCELLLRAEKNSSNKNYLVEGKLFVPGHILFAQSQENNFNLAAKHVFDDLREEVIKVKEKFAEKKILTAEEEQNEEL